MSIKADKINTAQYNQFMDFRHFTAGKNDDGRRIDKIVRTFLSEENLSSIYKSLRKGLIKVDGKKCDGNFRVSEGSDIQIASFLVKESPSQTTGKNIPPLNDSSIIFKNEALLFINKPYDVPVQPSPSSQFSLTEIVQSDYEKTHDKSASLSFKTGALHRLDRKTTGILAFSQNLEGAQWFSEQIKNHTVQKKYIALVQGNLIKAENWTDKIAKTEASDEKSFHTVKVNENQDGKISLTTATPLAHGKFNANGKEIPVTLTEFDIKTGRTHQIRSQASYHGFPLLGDSAYNGIKIDAHAFTQEFFLHAYELTFPQNNPFSLPERLYAPLPQSFQKIIKQIFGATLINCNSLLII